MSAQREPPYPAMLAATEKECDKLRQQLAAAQEAHDDLIKQVECVIELCGADAVRVKESNGPEQLGASLAVTVARVRIKRDIAQKALTQCANSADEAMARIAREAFAHAAKLGIRKEPA